MAGSNASRAGVRKTLRPGERGTLRFVRRFGDRLVCVRRRVDPAGLRRYVTVELVVEEAPLEVPSSAIVGVRVRLDEPVLRQRVKAAGGRWDARRRVWEVTYGAAQSLSLEDRIVTGPHLPSQGGNAAHKSLNLSPSPPRRRSA
jgi:hypothetical protein